MRYAEITIKRAIDHKIASITELRDFQAELDKKLAINKEQIQTNLNELNDLNVALAILEKT